MICPLYDSPVRPRPAHALLLGAAVALFVTPPLAATAADWPGEAPLRGSFEPPAPAGNGIRWDGINFGGFIGLTTLDTNFGSSTQDNVAYILRNTTLENEQQPSSWTALPNSVTNGRQFGGFLGYSMRLEDTIIGIDATYTRMSGAENSASDSITRQVSTSDNYTHVVTIDAQSTSKIIDYATLRGRAGYAFGQFLPYVFAGGAVARISYSSTSTVTSVETPPAAPAYTVGPLSQTTAKDNAIVFGFAGGLGLDVALTPNIFLRGEWEYATFTKVSGIANTMNSGRVGVGVRF